MPYINQLERDLALPIPLGPFARVLIDYHRNWGLDIDASDYEDQLQEATSSYRHEYSTSIGSRSRIIGSVGRNYNQELNEKNGTLVASLAFDIDGSINITDIGGGAGATTEFAYNAMKKMWLMEGRSLKDLKDRLYVTFVEPSRSMLRDAVIKLRGLGLNYSVLNIPADQLPDFLEHGSQKICMETAALHHYPDPQKPYTAIHSVLKPGGFFVVNEWSHSLFEHPARFRSVLEKLDWPTKEEDLKKYDDFFALGEYSEPENPLERAANKKMSDWYADRFSRTVDYTFFSLEAHCPPRLTLKHLRRAGFRTEDPIIDVLVEEGLISGNPDFLSPESYLHSTIVAVK